MPTLGQSAAAAHDHDHDHGGDDGHDHHDRADQHGHAHEPGSPTGMGRGAATGAMRRLAIALGITFAFMVVEAVGGWVSGSLALLADAAHMATDVAALGLALFAAWLAGRPPTRQRSYGFARAEILAALVNSALLGALTIWLFIETWHRLWNPEPVQTGPMLWVAIAGLGANAVSAWVLSRGGGDAHGHSHGHTRGGGGHSHDLNTRGALLHVLGDLLGSAAAIAAALIMMATGWWRADPILSGLIGFLVLWGAWRLMRESVTVLLEATPAHIDAQAVHDAMTAAPGVAGVHDLHIWTVASGMEAMSAHVVLDGSRPWTEVLTGQTALLRERFGIGHATLQPEDAHCGGCQFAGG